MWVRALRSDRLFPGEAMVVRIGHEEVALYNVDGRFHATGNRCPHQGGSLGDGYLEGDRITCPLHGWTFHVNTGHPAEISQPGHLRTYPTKEEQGEVWVDVPEEWA